MLIAHVGLPKAASSFLQRAVFSKHTDICYLGKNFTDPDLDRAGRSLTRRNSLRYDAASVISAFRGKMAASTQRVSLYSEEDLSSCKFVDVATMISRLQAIDGDCRFLIVTRNQIDWLQSLYFFYMWTFRREVMGGFETWVKEQLKLTSGIGGSLGPLLINPLVRAFEGDIGPKRVSIVPFEMLKSAPTEFCDRISSALGVNAAETRQLYANAGSAGGDKSRIGQPLADFLWLLRYQLQGERSLFFTEVERFVRDIPASYGSDGIKRIEQALRDEVWGYDAWVELFRAVAPLISKSTQGPLAKVTMSAELRAEIEHRAGVQNRAIAQRYNLDLGGLGYPIATGRDKDVSTDRSDRVRRRKDLRATRS